MTDTTGTTHYAYDLVGRLTSVTTPGGEVVEYSYNDAGQRSTLTYPDTSQVEYGYDPAGRLDTVTDWASREVSYSYDDAGRLTGAEPPNSTSSSFDYDGANRLTQITHTSQISGTIESIDYQLDNVGNRIVMTDTSGTTSYGYDDLYRLTGVTYPDSSATSYEYDPVGNRTVMTTSLGTTGYSYDNDDRLQAAGTVTYTWDNNGNMESKTNGAVTTDYTYDYADRLTQVADGTNTYQYSYNGDGIRVRKNVNGTSTDYVWDLTDSSGQVIGAYSYDVFGAVRSSSGTVSNDFQFGGEQLDETGLIYLRARYYDPTTGRFMTKDPLPGSLADPQSQNLYIYCQNRPTSLIDPSGMGVTPPPEAGTWQEGVKLLVILTTVLIGPGVAVELWPLITGTGVAAAEKIAGDCGPVVEGTTLQKAAAAADKALSRLGEFKPYGGDSPNDPSKTRAHFLTNDIETIRALAGEALESANALFLPDPDRFGSESSLI